MKTQSKKLLIAMGIAIGASVPQGPSYAAINPINAVAGSPTISIIDQASGRDISDTWLPEPGQAVKLIVNGLVAPTIALDTANTTSYPGICTNYGADSGLDFTLDIDVLIANDCGGTATVLVNGIAFKLPADANNNGIADIWEATRGGNLIATQDLDLSPSTSDTTQPTSDPNCLNDCRKGDGIAAFDEYRGFIVSNADRTAGVPFAGLPGTKHIRTEPAQKDIFVHVVNNQCAPANPPAVLGTFLRYFPAGGRDMFEFAHTVFPGSIHVFDFTPGAVNPIRSTLWEDFFEQYAIADPDGTGPLSAGVVFRTAGNVLSNKEADVPTDRQINKNALFPIVDLKTNTPVQKGIRLIECQVVDTLTTLGIADWGTPNKAGSAFATKAGNSIVFTERVRRDVATKITNAGLRQLRWAVYDPAVARWVLQPDVVPKDQNGQDFLAGRQMQYLIAHELTHGAQLRPTSTNGYHSTTGSGSIMDAAIQVINDKTNSGTAKTQFNIPSRYLTSDQQEIKTKN